jgi:predicted DNA-binding protein YlxM (UPF0122 family)
MKASIDRYVNRNYNKLVCIAQSYCNEFGRTYKGESVVSNVYMLALEKPPKREEDIPRYITGLIKREVFFPNSTTAREEECRMLEVKTNTLEAVSNIDEALIIIDFEDKYAEFLDKLTRKERIVSVVYFEKGKRTIRELAEHFDIPRSSLHDEIKEVLKKIKDFENESKKRIRASND